MKTKNLSGIVNGYFTGGLIAVTLLTFTAAACINFWGRDTTPLQSENLTGVSGSLNGKAVKSPAPADSLVFTPDLQEVLVRLEGSSRPERLLILHGLFGEAKLNGLEQLLVEIGRTGESIYSFEIQRAVVQQMSTRDPRYTLKTIGSLQLSRGNQLVEIVFQEWAMRNLDEAIEFAETLGYDARAAALDGLLHSRLDLPHDRLLKIARSLGIERHFLDGVAIRAMDEKIEDPRKRWHELFNEIRINTDTLSDAQKQLVVQVGALHLAKGGSEALQDILGTLANRELRSSILEEIVERVAMRDPETVLNLIKDADGLEQNTLRGMLRAYARFEPEKAHEAAREADAGGIRMQRTVVESWATIDPVALLTSLDRLPKTLRAWGREIALNSLARQDPVAAAAKLEGVGDEYLKRNIARFIARQWAKDDPRAAFEWSKTNQDDEDLSTELQDIVLRRVAMENPQLAMEMAMGEELAGGIGLEASVISAVAAFNVEEAIAMLGNSRNKATRIAAVPDIGKALVTKGRSDQALALVNDEPIEAKREYFNLIVNAWAESDYEDLYRKRSKLPDDEQTMARVAIAISSISSLELTSFTADQEKFLLKHLPPAFLPNLDQ